MIFIHPNKWRTKALTQILTLIILKPRKSAEKTLQNVGSWISRMCCALDFGWPCPALLKKKIHKEQQDNPNMVKNQLEAIFSRQALQIGMECNNHSNHPKDSNFPTAAINQLTKDSTSILSLFICNL